MRGADSAGRKVRPPGRGGANDLASFGGKTLIVRKHDAKKFVAKLDFLTTPGYLTGPGAREAAGLPAGTGPDRVIPGLGVLDFHPDPKRMRVISLHPGRSLDDIRRATGFELAVADELGVTPAPTALELHLLRTQVDPGRFLLGRDG